VWSLGAAQSDHAREMAAQTYQSGGRGNGPAPADGADNQDRSETMQKIMADGPTPARPQSVEATPVPPNAKETKPERRGWWQRAFKSE